MKENFTRKSLLVIVLLVGSLRGWGQATLPTSFSGSGWITSLPMGWTESGFGTDYVSSYDISGGNAGKLDNAGDDLVINFTGTPNTLTYYLGGNGLSGSYQFDILESADGTAYTTVRSHTSSTNSIANTPGSLWSSSLLNTTRYVKFIYTIKATGNIGIDGVSITGTPLYYRSHQSGDWNNSSTWESSSDGFSWNYPQIYIPSSNDHTITIQSPHTVTVSSPISLDETTIAGTLQILSPNPYSSTITVGPAASAINVSTGGKIEIGDGVVVVGTGYETFATSALNTWNSASVFEWNSPTNFVFDNNTYFPNAGAAIPKFIVTKVTGPIGGANPATINGLLIANTSFTFSGNGNKNFRNGISGNGTLTLSTITGTYNITSVTSEISGPLTLILMKDIHINLGTTVTSGSAITISNTSTQGFIRDAGSFLIDANGKLDMGSTATITNTATGNVTVKGTFATGNPGGFTGVGATIPGGVVILNTGCTVEYNALGNQTVSSRADYQNITFSGSGIKTVPTFTPTGTLTITGSAIVDASSNNIGDGVIGKTNFTMDGGRLILGTTGTQPMMNGIYNLTSGIIQYTNSSATAETIRSPETYYAIEVTGSNVGNSLGNINLAANGSFTVKSGGKFAINADQITGTLGTQTIIVESGAIFQCGSADGFSGGNGSIGNNTSIKFDIETITLALGSLVDYSRNNVQVITNQIPYQNLSISGTGIKTAPSGVLTIQGNLTKSGPSTFAHNNGTVLLNGANQTFAGFTYDNLILTNNTKTTSGNSTIIDSIKINDGTMLSIRGTPDTITLHSDALKTARVGQVGTGTINYNTSGKFVIERYISDHRAWRYLSVPVTSQTIRGAWQENGTSGATVRGLGTQISGPQGIAAGFDLYSDKPSLKTFNPSINDYDAVAATTLPLDISKGGYMLFVRGDRNTTYPATSSTTLRTTGQLFTGNQGLVSVSNQFTPVNNPYPSQIDMVKLSPDGTTYPAFYVWDPNLGGTYGYGSFVTFIWNPGTLHFDITNSGGSYADGDHIIDNGQAFLVSTLGTGFSIPVTENVKTGAPLLGGLTPFTPVAHPGQQVRTFLYTTDKDGNYYVSDCVLNNYGDNFSNDIDGMDARKYLNNAENISIARCGMLLGIERRQTLHLQDTIFFEVSNLKPGGAYRFVFVPSNIDESGLQPYLEDGYLHTSIPLRLNDSTWVNFINDGSTGSIAPDRFRIVFQAAEGPLSLMLTTVKAYTKNEGIAVEWNVKNETGMKSYVVEKSADGRTRFVSSNVIAANNNGLVNNYSWLDEQPLAGCNYYRIKSIGINGQLQYSKVIKVWEGDSKSGISVYPNPSRNGIIHLLFNNQPAGKYAIRLINKWGQVVCSKQIQHTNAGRSSEEIAIDQYTAHGVYRLEVIEPGGDSENINLVY